MDSAAKKSQLGEKAFNYLFKIILNMCAYESLI